MKKKNWRTIVFGFALSLLGVGCGGILQVLPPEIGLIIFPERVVVASGTQVTYVARQIEGEKLGAAVPATWRLVGDVGTINTNGVFTATKVGVGTIVASYEASGASAHVWVASGTLSSLTLDPASASLQAGSEQLFTATGFDAGGNVLTVPVSFEVVTDGDGPSLGVIDEGGLFSAQRVGTGIIRAYAGEITADSQINVTAGPLARIEVITTNGSIPAGQSQQYSAQGFDAFDNPISISPKWSLSGPRGDMSSSGVLLAKYVGTSDVIATVGSMSGRTSVTVSAGPAASIKMTPDVRVVDLRDTVSFSAQVADAYGNPVPQGAIGWSVVGDIGDVEGDGKFTARQLGKGTVQARVDSLTSSAQVEVVMGPGFFEREVGGVMIGETMDAVRDRVGGVTELLDSGGVQTYRAGNGVVLEVASGVIRTIEVSGALTFRGEGGIGIGDDILSVIDSYGEPEFIGTDAGGREAYFFPNRALRVWTRNGDVVTFNITNPDFAIPGPISPNAIQPLTSL